MADKHDLVQRIIDFEMGEMQTEEEVLDFFQDLINTGMAWRLQGSYGRTAASLIDQGLLSDGPKVVH
jgi:hypothetical protein